MTQSLCIYANRRERQRQSDLDLCSPTWAASLPTEWRLLAVEPRSFRVHREHEMAARRVFGYDLQGTPCFYAHDYRQHALRSDDDEDFYESLAYGESVTAWRLQDGRWLVHQLVEPLGDEGSTEHGLRIQARMPQ